jgi:transposase InsO family protein
VSESWFHKWRDKPTTAREVRRGQLAAAIRQIFENSGGTYGSPKVWLLLIRAGWRVSVNTVARLMAELGLAWSLTHIRPAVPECAGWRSRARRCPFIRRGGRG